MKNRISKLIVFTLMLSAAFAVSVFASGFSVDSSQTSKGVVEVKGTAGAKPIRVMIEKAGDTTRYTYLYSKTNKNIYPLQLGNGKYTVTVLENVAGNEYKKLIAETVDVAGVSDAVLYTNSIQLIDYSGSSSVKEMNKLVASAGTETEKVDVIFNYVITNFDYDFEKAKTVANDYLPVIDTIYTAKKGICYDYSSVFAGVMRSNGIPTKLQMGYNKELGEQYHAWNEIYVGGSWFKVDTTYDAQVKKANLTVTMKKDNANFTVLKQY